MENRNCSHCGKDIPESRRQGAKYCEDKCGDRARRQKHYRLNPEKYRLKRLSDNQRDAERMIYRVKHRAKRNGTPFDITFEDIQVPEICPVLGLSIKNGVGTGRWQDCSPSLDRIKPELGYVKGNIRVISARANLLKSNATVEELEKVLEDLRRLS